MAVSGAERWMDALHSLGLAYHGRSIERLRRWSARWDIDTSHLVRAGTGALSRFTNAEIEAAVAGSRSWAEALRSLGYCPTGGNPSALKARTARLGISAEHFDPRATARERRRAVRIDDVLVERSTYSRAALKERLFSEGLKARICELCGQDERWRGREMGLILDHVNGVRDDNRLENLRIVCPNCAATLDTHCGRKTRLGLRDCVRCGTEFKPKKSEQRYCSRECGSRWDRTGRPVPATRRAERPAYPELREEVMARGYSAVGRQYGVSDNAIRKWLRAYQREGALD